MVYSTIIRHRMATLNKKSSQNWVRKKCGSYNGGIDPYTQNILCTVYTIVLFLLLDMEELQREIAMMRNMMLCKGCGAPATCINIGCGHLMCCACCKMHICKLCASQITEVADVKFSHQE